MTDRVAGAWPADGRAPGEPRRTLTLTDLNRIPLHRWRLVGSLGLIGLLAAVGYVLLVPTTVDASAVLAVRPVVTDAFTSSGVGADRSVNMNVESGIATSTGVVQKIAAEIGKEELEVREALTVEVPTGGQILRLVYTARTADEAVKTVNLAAATYLETRRAMYEEQRSLMLKSYDESIAKVVAEQQAVQRRTTSTNQGTADAALAELPGINNQLAQLSNSRTEIASIDVSPGWVTQSAEPSLVSTGVNRLLYLVAGMLGGLLLGVVLSYLREATNRRVRTAADAQEASGLPLLGTVRRRGFRVGAHAVDADVRYVAMAIAERFGAKVPTPVVVIASRAVEDTTLLTASLAVALAADGRDVFVADDSGRLARLREVLMADRRRVPTVPFVPAQRPAADDDDTVVVSDAGTIPDSRRPRPSPLPASIPAVDSDATITLPRISSSPTGEPAAGEDHRRQDLGADPARRHGDGGQQCGPGRAVPEGTGERHRSLQRPAGRVRRARRARGPQRHRGRGGGARPDPDGRPEQAGRPAAVRWRRTARVRAHPWWPWLSRPGPARRRHRRCCRSGRCT